MIDLRQLNLKLTKKDIKESVTGDVLIIQSIHTIDELLQIVNRLVVNLRERYGYYAAEQSKIDDQGQFLETVKKLKREEMGAEFAKKDLDPILELVKLIEQIITVEKSQEKYLESIMKKECSNLFSATDALIGARLISHAGSLKHLAELPTSTIQLLGAEKALFRHLKLGSRPPKFGVIFLDKSITDTKEKGKVARHLASKISLAAKKDYFKNEI